MAAPLLARALLILLSPCAPLLSAATFQETKAAAAAGKASAQYELGAMYAEGRGAPQDRREAFILYRKAAEQGYVPAEFALGSLYETTEDSDSGRAIARLWFEKAAAHGHKDARKHIEALERGGHPGDKADNGRGPQSPPPAPSSASIRASKAGKANGSAARASSRTPSPQGPDASRTSSH